MKNIIIIAVLVLIIAFAILYIYKAKKSGKKCIGCPYADNCGKKQCSCDGTKKH